MYSLNIEISYIEYYSHYFILHTCYFVCVYSKNVLCVGSSNLRDDVGDENTARIEVIVV